MNLLERIEENVRRLFVLPENVLFEFDYEFSDPKMKQWGSCSFNESPTDTILISIAPLEKIGNLAEMLLTVCHEVIHAQQVLDGRFAVYQTGKKRLYRFENDFYKLDDVAYEDRPWEAEAFAKQMTYLCDFVRECDEVLYDLVQKDIADR